MVDKPSPQSSLKVRKGIVSYIIPFPVCSNLIDRSVFEDRIGVFFSLIERISWFLVEFRSISRKYIHNYLSYASLSPNNSS